MESENEVFFSCPYCWEQISMLIETHVSQSYVEDCEVCCQPIQLTYTVQDGAVLDIRATSLDGE